VGIVYPEVPAMAAESRGSPLEERRLALQRRHLTRQLLSDASAQATTAGDRAMQNQRHVRLFKSGRSQALRFSRDI